MHWLQTLAEPCCLSRGRVGVNWMHRFDRLQQLGRNYQEAFGRDKGNGWLLNHPLKKLQLYQAHLGIKPSVDFSKLPDVVSHL